MNNKEERFKELIEGIEINKPVVDFEVYPTSLLWFKDNVLCFRYNWKTNILWIHWSLVWNVFEKEYNMEPSDVQSFMRVMVEEHFKLKGVTPSECRYSLKRLVEEHFKLNGVTPN